jgi:hypothetical protein
MVNRGGAKNERNYLERSFERYRKKFPISRSGLVKDLFDQGRLPGRPETHARLFFSIEASPIRLGTNDDHCVGAFEGALRPARPTFRRKSTQPLIEHAFESIGRESRREVVDTALMHVVVM